jgi:NADH-quinone oxidoreductase subunit F
VVAVAAQGHSRIRLQRRESEPGTFKDRVLMENDPFALVESMTIEGFAVGASKGYLYIRGEYPLAESRVRGAIDQARAAGYLGPSVMGSDFAFDIEVRRGAGAYICGEETALFESIEGKRGEPRNKPPFPVEVGLFGKPTVINNVETLANVPLIVLGGGDAFAATGTEGSTGPKLFCLSGHVTRPGVYEVEFGATLRELIELAGGVPGGREIRTILLGGAAGVFVGPEALDTPLTFEGTRAAGATLGSGVIMVFDETADLVGILRRIAQFFRDESCGQCVPCRVGTARQEELLARLATGSTVRPREEELALLGSAGRARRVICGLANGLVSVDRHAPAGAGGAVTHARRLRPVAPPHATVGELAPPGIVYTTPPARASRTPVPPPSAPPAPIHLQIDGAAVEVPAGSTILDACRAQGLDIPTLCYLENLTPVNVCRVCVVEVKGSRVLAPACSRRVEEGMEVETESERVRHSRKVVLEFLGSSVDLSLAGPRTPDGDAAVQSATAIQPVRAAGPGAAAHERDDRGGAPSGAEAARRPSGSQGRQRALRPRLLEVHPLLQVRRGLRRGRPEHVRDRRGGARLRCANLHGVGRTPAGFGLRVLRQLHRRLPDGRADVQERARHARGGHLGRVGPDRDLDDLPVLRRRLRGGPPRPGQHDREGHVADGLGGHRGPPVRQGPLRLRARAREGEGLTGLLISLQIARADVSWRRSTLTRLAPYASSLPRLPRSSAEARSAFDLSWSHAAAVLRMMMAATADACGAAMLVPAARPSRPISLKTRSNTARGRQASDRAVRSPGRRNRLLVLRRRSRTVRSSSRRRRSGSDCPCLTDRGGGGDRDHVGVRR